MKKDAYSYLPAAFILLLLAINAWLMLTNADYKQANRELTLENDSLISVNQKLQQVVSVRGGKVDALAEETRRR